MTAEQCELLAEILAGDWKKLATELNFSDEQIGEIEVSGASDDGKPASITVQAENLLSAWMVGIH